MGVFHTLTILTGVFRCILRQVVGGDGVQNEAGVLSLAGSRQSVKKRTRPMRYWRNTMKNVLVVLAVVLACGLSAFAQEVPKAELFMGYEYIRFAPSLSGNPSVNFNGGGGSVNFNINKVLGIKAEFTGAGTGNLKQCDATGLNCVTRSGNFFTYLFGPQLSYRKNSRVTPFAHLLFGGSHSNLYANLAPVSTTPTTAEPNKEAFTLAVGGGLDVNAGKHIAIRLAQVDYFMTRFSEVGVTPSGATQQINNQSNFRYMGGIVFRLGRKNILPPSVTCSAAKSSIIQGETTTVKANGTDPEGAGLTYSWTATGGKVTGSGDNVTFDSTGLNPGKYTVTVNVSDGKYSASCPTEVTVLKKNQPPTIACEPPSASIMPGESASIRGNASDPDNDRLTYSWTVNGQPLAATDSSISFGSEGRQPGQYTVAATVSDGEFKATCSSTVTIRERPNRPPTIECLTSSLDVASGGSTSLRVRASDPDGDKVNITWSAPSGTVSGAGDTATYTATGVKAGSYVVTATADDGKGGRASCTVAINVSERISLTNDEKCGFFKIGGTYVDNCAKAVLDDTATRMQSEPRLHANIIGYTDAREKSPKNLGEKRAQAVAKYLAGKGIDSSRMTITDGHANNPVADNAKAAGRRLNRRVEIELAIR